MGCKLVLFSFFVISSVLVDSFPNYEENNDQRNYQLYKNNINPLWPTNKGIAQSTQNPIFLWNHQNNKVPEGPQMNGNSVRPFIPYDYGQNIKNQYNERPQMNDNSARPLNRYNYGQNINNQNNERPQTNGNSARPLNRYDYGQNINNQNNERPQTNSNSARPFISYDYGQKNYQNNVTPMPFIHGSANNNNQYTYQWPNAQYSTPAPLNGNSGLWNNQRINQPQQNHIYGTQPPAKTFLQNYDRPYTNQGNYGQMYPHYQSAGLITPKPNFNSYGQGWQSQNQINYISTPNPVKYQPWYVSDQEKRQPIQPNFVNNYNIPSSSTTRPVEYMTFLPDNQKAQPTESNLAYDYSKPTTSTSNPVEYMPSTDTQNPQPIPASDNSQSKNNGIIPSDSVQPAITYDNSQENISITQTTESPQSANTSDYYYEYEDIDHNEKTKYNTQNTKSYTSEQTRTGKDIKENNFDGFDTIKSRNVPKWTTYKRGYDYDMPGYYNGPDKTYGDNDGNITPDLTPTSESSISNEPTIDSETENDNSLISGEPREDLEIDVSELKTVVDKPVVWFRRDGSFWDKVTKGEQAYDALTLYDVHCKPKLIERLTTIHHYPNGTEIVDYVENIWDSPDDIQPRKTKSNRVFREP